MIRRACSRSLAHVVLGLLLSLHVASPRDPTPAARWHKQQVALEPSLATWTEAYERCAALGSGLAPHELAAQAPFSTHPQCATRGSDATVVWVDSIDGNRESPPILGRQGLHTDEHCHGLIFNHTSRQAQLAGKACDQRHCFLCLAQQAVVRKSTTRSVHIGRRRLMDANSTHGCDETGPQIQQAWLPGTSCTSFCLLYSVPCIIQ
jgi:hypothetical protein